jgi:hypothetical protein
MADCLGDRLTLVNETSERAVIVNRPVIIPNSNERLRLVGSCVPTTPPPVVWTNTKSFILDGVDEHITVPHSASLDITNNLSFFAWIKTTNASTQMLASKYDTLLDQRSWAMWFNSSGTFEVYLTEEGDTLPVKQYRSIASYNDGAWHFVGFTFSSNVLKLYADGLELTPVKLTDGTVNSLFSNTEPVDFGSLKAGAVRLWYWSGNIEEPVIYDTTVLSPANVNTLWTGGPKDLAAQSVDGNLVSWWRMGDDALDDATGGSGNIEDVIGVNNGIPINTEPGDIVLDVP